MGINGLFWAEIQFNYDDNNETPEASHELVWMGLDGFACIWSLTDRRRVWLRVNASVVNSGTQSAVSLTLICSVLLGICSLLWPPVKCRSKGQTSDCLYSTHLTQTDRSERNWTDLNTFAENRVSQWSEHKRTVQPFGLIMTDRNGIEQHWRQESFTASLSGESQRWPKQSCD